MLKDTEQSDMDECVVSIPGEKMKPFLLCKLCHCEFTNIKEHVKSLVHLDARETKLNTKQTVKHKTDCSDDEVNAKKPKIADEEVSIIDKGNSAPVEGTKSSTQSAIDTETTGKSSADNSGKEAASEQNSTGSTEKDLVEKAGLGKVSEGNAPGSIENEVTGQEKQFLLKHWCCSLCVHVHRAEDGSFDEHALTEDHQMAQEARLKGMQHDRTWRKTRRWIYVCHACLFRTNDKDPFLSHIQSADHDAQVKTVLETLPKNKAERRADAKRARTPNDKTEASAEADQPVKAAAPPGTAALNQKHQNKQNTNQKNQNKQDTNVKNQNQDKQNTNVRNQNQNKQSTNVRNQNQNKHTGNTNVKNQTQNQDYTAKSTVQNIRTSAAQNPASQGPSKKPANQNQSGSKHSPVGLQQSGKRAPQSSTANRNPQGWNSNVPSHIGKPGVLGEYRPSFRDDQRWEDRFGRSDTYPGSGASLSYPSRSQGSTLSFGADRLGNPEPRRDSSLSTSLSSGFGSDFRRPFNSERHDQGVSRHRPLLETPVRELHSDPAPAPYRSTGSDLSARHLSRHSDLSPSRSGYLPSFTSLDLASSSSLRLRDALSLPLTSSVGPRYSLDRPSSYDHHGLFSRR